MAELLRDSVYRALRQAVLTCEFQPGQELREQVLAEKDPCQSFTHQGFAASS